MAMTKDEFFRQPLHLVREAKLASLLAGAGGDRLEASGVLAAGGGFYVIFDNAPDIARIEATLSPAAAGSGLIRQPRGRRAGFEDLAHDPAAGRFYVLVEGRPRNRGFMAEVQEYDERFGYLERAWLQFPLEGPNKGLEGLTCVHREGRTYLLGLCEGNRCRDGAEGRRHWDRVATIRLPATLPFEDFSSLTVAGDRLAVLSQASSRGSRGCRPTRWSWYQTGPSARARTSAAEPRTSRSTSSPSRPATDQVPALVRGPRGSPAGSPGRAGRSRPGGAGGPWPPGACGCRPGPR
jgi:hypothetical protein